MLPRISDISMTDAASQIFRKSVEFCNEQDVWKLNVAHVLFMQARPHFGTAALTGAGGQVQGGEWILRRHCEEVRQSA